MARAHARVTVEIGPAEAVADLLAGLHGVIDGDASDGQTVRDSVVRLLEAFAASKPEIGLADALATCPECGSTFDANGDDPVRWSLPAEPGPEVKAVRDEGGRLWERGVAPLAGTWIVRHPATGHVELSRIWMHLVPGFGPLTDATGEVAS